MLRKSALRQVDDFFGWVPKPTPLRVTAAAVAAAFLGHAHGLASLPDRSVAEKSEMICVAANIAAGGEPSIINAVYSPKGMFGNSNAYLAEDIQAHFKDIATNIGNGKFYNVTYRDIDGDLVLPDVPDWCSPQTAAVFVPTNNPG